MGATRRARAIGGDGLWHAAASLLRHELYRLDSKAGNRRRCEAAEGSSIGQQPGYYRNEKIGGDPEEESYDNPRASVDLRIQPSPYLLYNLS